MLPRAKRRGRKTESTDLDLAPYMNLMVVLAPFLLITAVFTRLTVLEIDLPTPTAELETRLPPLEETLSLTISITEKALVVASGSRILRIVDTTVDGTDLEMLSSTLQEIKTKYPQVEDAVILSRPGIEYGVLVQVMDAVRMAVITTDGRTTRHTLFPNIALGELP